MKKNTNNIALFLFVSFCFNFCIAQQKIGTNPTTMNSSALLELESHNKALLISRVINTAAIVNPINGMIIYDMSSNCIKFYENNAWTGCISLGTTFAINSILEQIGSEADDPDVINSTLTIAQLNALGIANVNSNYISVYQDYIDANPNLFSNPATIVEIQTAVNTTNSLATSSGGTALVSSYNCSTTANSGILTVGIPVNSVTQDVEVNVEALGTYNVQVTSNGITFSRSGTFSSLGTQTITLNATGTPLSSGTHSFILPTSPSCTFTRNINELTMPTSITIAQNSSFFIASIYDEDYLPYSAPTTEATLVSQAADGVNESTIINLQGSITTSGIQMKLPVTTTGSDILPAFSTNVVIPAAMTEDGNSRTIQFSWAEQNFTTATKTINATIASIGGTLNLKKLDLNAGLGNNVLGVLFGQISYPYNSIGTLTNLKMRIIPGIPDRMFGLADNNNNSFSHMMLYLPQVAEDGKVWLNNNLGAHYSNLNHPNFNLTQQAVNFNDHLAYGSLFQWGRKPDGHELISFSSSTAGTPIYGVITELNNNPSHANFIKTSTSDWRVNQDDTLWLAENSTNNPCPIGYKIPSITELNNLFTAAGITNYTNASTSILKFTTSGLRSNADGSLGNLGTAGVYWSSTTQTTSALRRFITNTNSQSVSATRPIAYSVRCIAN